MKNQQKIAIVVGRFQTAALHPGHLFLLNHAKANHHQVLVLLGVSPVKASPRNPLTAVDRQQMIQELNVLNPRTTTYAPLYDTKEDAVWSQEIDKTIALNYGQEAQAVIYGSRDSSLKSYSGKHETEEIPEFGKHNASESRARLKSEIHHSLDYRIGKILAYQDMYPIMYSTVDAAIISQKTGEYLFGRKPGESQYRFIGGFVDVTDNTRKDAVIREVREETQLEVIHAASLFSMKVNDWRYNRERDKIMTDMFLCFVESFDAAVASDDLAVEKGGELKAFALDAITEEMLIDTHRPLLAMLKSDSLIKYQEISKNYMNQATLITE